MKDQSEHFRKKEEGYLNNIENLKQEMAINQDQNQKLLLEKAD